MLLVDKELPWIGLMKGIISWLIKSVVMANFLKTLKRLNQKARPFYNTENNNFIPETAKLFEMIAIKREWNRYLHSRWPISHLSLDDVKIRRRCRLLRWWRRRTVYRQLKCRTFIFRHCRTLIPGYTVKLAYNKLSRTGTNTFVITVIRYNREGLCCRVNIWDLKKWSFFVRFNREFAITVIVITEFDCILTTTKHVKIVLIRVN